MKETTLRRPCKELRRHCEGDPLEGDHFNPYGPVGNIFPFRLASQEMEDLLRGNDFPTMRGHVC